MASQLSTAQLSQELIDNVLDILAADKDDGSTQSLRRCALVSQSFRPRSQSHLFSNISIRGSNERQRKIQDLLDVMDQNPDIADYISELDIEFSGIEYSWIFDDPDFIEVLKRKSAADRPLRKVTFRADTIADDGYSTLPFQHHDLARMLKEFFLPYISPFITCLSLHRLSGIPIEAVTSCVHLTELELLHVEFATDTRAAPFPQLKPLRLQRLALRLARPALDRLLGRTNDEPGPALDVSELRAFTIYTDGQSDLQFEQDIIGVCKDSLEDLQIIPMQTSSNGIFQGFADLQQVSHLKSLHAHAMFPEDGLRSVMRTLSSIRTHTLSNLIVDAKVGFCLPAEPEALLKADWESFCSEVARVLSATDPTFEFKMTYLYRDRFDIDMLEYKRLVQGQCDEVMKRLRRESLEGLEEKLGKSIKLSIALEFDTALQTTLD